MSPVIKHFYLTALIGGVLLVGVGQMIVIIRAANGRSSGDGFYQTTSEERAHIRARADDHAPPHDLSVPLTAEDSSEIEPDVADHAGQPELIPAQRDRSVAVAANNATRSISRPSETIDVTVSGSRNSVTIKRGTQLNLLSIAGVSISVTFEEETNVKRISVSGVDNVVVIPEGVEFRITDSGVRTRISRPNLVDTQARTSGEDAEGNR